MKKKVVLIGSDDCGYKHFSELRRSDNFDLVGILCKNKNNYDFGKFKVFNDMSDMFMSVKPDATIITNPTKELILKCIRYSKNIFSEPLKSISLSEIREINYAVKTNNINFTIGFNLRFNPAILSIIKELKKESDIFSINFINYDKDEYFLLECIDLLKIISNSEISSFISDKTYEKNSKIIKNIGCILKMKNGILANLLCLNSENMTEKIVEITTKNGIFYADLNNLTLTKKSQNGRVNFKVEKDNFAIRNMHKEFANFCENPKNNTLSNIDETIKILETIK